MNKVIEGIILFFLLIYEFYLIVFLIGLIKLGFWGIV